MTSAVIRSKNNNNNCHHDTHSKYGTFFLEAPSVKYKQYTTTAGMYINKSATRTEREHRNILYM